MKSDLTERKNAQVQGLADQSIVVIEPNKQMQVLLRAMVAGFGCRNLRVFADMDSAVSSMLTDMPTVLLMDWDAPPYGGRSFIKLIRHEKMFPVCLLPVIALFSVARQRQVEAAVRLGAQSVIVKPVSPEVLLQRICWATNAQKPLKLVGERYVVDGMAQQLDAETAKRKQLAAARQYQIEQVDALISLQDDVDRIIGSVF